MSEKAPGYRLDDDPGFRYPTGAQAFVELLEMGRSDGVSCWRSESVERREGSDIEGRGLFATEDIPVNTLIAIKQGHVVSSGDVKDNAAVIQGSQQQIGPNEFLAGLTEEEVDRNLVGYNHSCDPNATVVIPKGASLAFLVTRKPVTQGQEITADYSASQMTNTHLLKLCRCGSPECRGVVAPLWDWEDEKIQERYRGEFPWFIQEAIDEQKALPPEEAEANRRQAATLKLAAVTVMADEEIKLLEAKRDNAVAGAEAPLLSSIASRVYGRSPAGRELADTKNIRLEAAAMFALVCPFANIEEFGVDRSELLTVLDTKTGVDHAALGERLAGKLDAIVGFAKKLDYLFNG